MKEVPKEDIEKLLIDSLIERPICFELDGHFFYLYQPSLGISLMSANYLKELQPDPEILQYDEEMEMLRLIHTHKENMIRVIAMHSFRRRSDALNEDMMRERQIQFAKLELPALVVLTRAILEWNAAHDKLIKHFNLDKEQQQRLKIAELKNKDRSSINFGGRSLYGSMIDYAAERYGWQVGYIMWGVSITNLHMLMSDASTSVFLTKEERKGLNISTDGVFLNMDDPETKKKIAQMYGKKKKNNKTTTTKEKESQIEEKGAK